MISLDLNLTKDGGEQYKHIIIIAGRVLFSTQEAIVCAAGVVGVGTCDDFDDFKPLSFDFFDNFEPLDGDADGSDDGDSDVGDKLGLADGDGLGAAGGDSEGAELESSPIQKSIAMTGLKSIWLTKQRQKFVTGMKSSRV